MAKKKTATAFPKPHASVAIEKKIIDAGKHLFRIHPSAYGGNQFNDSVDGDAR